MRTRDWLMRSAGPRGVTVRASKSISKLFDLEPVGELGPLPPEERPDACKEFPD